MINWGMIICAVISFTFRVSNQYYLNWSCDYLSLSHHNPISADLVVLLTMVLLVNPTHAEFYVWIGELDCGKPISMSVLRSGIIFSAVMYNAPISDSAAEAITSLMICAIVNMGPFIFGFGSFYKRKIWAPDLLQAFDS